MCDKSLYDFHQSDALNIIYIFYKSSSSKSFNGYKVGCRDTSRSPEKHRGFVNSTFSTLMKLLKTSVFDEKCVKQIVKFFTYYVTTIKTQVTKNIGKLFHFSIKLFN